MYCICCKKNNVKPMKSDTESEEELLWKSETKARHDGQIIYSTIDNEMVDGGIIHLIDAGYGSKHDGDRFILAICDDCIEENEKNGTLLYWGNYMGFSFTEDEVEKSKLMYRRSNNLDELTKN